MNATGLRIAVVGPLPPPAGGMANQTAQLAELLRREGADVTLVQVNAAYRPAWVGRWRGLRALFRLARYVPALWRAFGRVDVVHVMANSGIAWFVFAMPAVLLARARSKPVAINYRGGGADRFLRRAAWVVRPLVRLADALLVPSGYLQAIFRSHGIDSTIVPNVIDLARFTPAARGWNADAPHLIVTRNLEPIYDIPTALRMFAHVRRECPAARMTVAGEGPQRAALEALAAQLGVREAVTFSGRIDNARIADLYRSATVFVNPSRVDNMPISVLEALASGVPVVSTDVGGVPYLVEHERTALLVPAGDPTRLAGAVLRVLREAGLAARLIDAGRTAVRRYEWASVGPQLLGVYRRMTAAAPGARMRAS